MPTTRPDARLAREKEERRPEGAAVVVLGEARGAGGVREVAGKPEDLRPVRPHVTRSHDTAPGLGPAALLSTQLMAELRNGRVAVVVRHLSPRGRVADAHAASCKRGYPPGLLAPRSGGVYGAPACHTTNATSQARWPL